MPLFEGLKFYTNIPPIFSKVWETLRYVTIYKHSKPFASFLLEFLRISLCPDGTCYFVADVFNQKRSYWCYLPAEGLLKGIRWLEHLRGIRIDRFKSSDYAWRKEICLFSCACKILFSFLRPAWNVDEEALLGPGVSSQATFRFSFMHI